MSKKPTANQQKHYNELKSLITLNKDQSPNWDFLEHHIKQDMEGINTINAHNGYIILQKKGKHYVYSKEHQGQIFSTRSTSDLFDKMNSLIRKSNLKNKENLKPISEHTKSLRAALEKNTEHEKTNIKALEKELHISSYIEDQMHKGKSLDEVLDDLEKTEDESLKIDLKGKSYYRSKYNPKNRTSKEKEIIEEGASEREGILSSLRGEIGSKKDSETLEARILSNPNTGSKAISDKANAISQEFGKKELENISPSLLHRLTYSDIVREAAEKNKPIYDIIHDKTTRLLENPPTVEQAEDLYNNSYKNKYRGLQPHRNKLHNLASLGHGPRSSSVNAAQGDYKSAMDADDIDKQRSLYELHSLGHKDQLGHLEKTGKLLSMYQEGVSDPYLTAMEKYQQNKNQENQNQFNDFQNNMSVSEAEYKNSMMNDQNQLNLNERLNQMDDRSLIWVQSIQSQIDTLQKYLNSSDLLGKEEEARIQHIENNLWNERFEITRLISQFNAEAAAELQRQQTPSAFARVASKMAPPVLAAASAAAVGYATKNPSMAFEAGNLAYQASNSAINNQPLNTSNIPTGNLFNKDNWKKTDPTPAQMNSTYPSQSPDSYVNHLLGR